MSSLVSSSGALSRSRSLRKPSSRPETTTRSGLNGDGAQRSHDVSPSRLPIKGSSKGGTSTATVNAPRTTRPLSGVFARVTSTTSSARQGQHDSPGPEAPPSAAPGRLTRTASTRQPSTASVRAAPSAITRPTTSSGVPTSRPRVASTAGAGTAPDSGSGLCQGHTRAKSSVTTLSSATTLRPPSQVSSSSSSTTTTTTTTARIDRSRPPLTSQTRRPSGTRPPAPPSPTTTTPSTPSSPKPAVKPPPRPGPASGPGADAANLLAGQPSGSAVPARHQQQQQAQQQQQQQPHRPPFTTHQQHFSPLKSLAPKPLTATFLAPPSPSKHPANVAASAETSRLQTELLQLHLLHRHAAPLNAQWRASARAKLRARWEAVGVLEGEVTALEREVEEARNAAAILDWCGGKHKGMMGTGTGVDEQRVGALAEVLDGVWAAQERYARVVRAFEKWVGRVEVVFSARRRAGQDVDADVGLVASRAENEEEQDQGLGLTLIGEMDAAWKAECAALGRRLDGWRRTLAGLVEYEIDKDTEKVGRIPGETAEADTSLSSLERILQACRVLVHGMLAELGVMELIEREAVAEEMRWVRDMNRRGLGGGAHEESRRAGAIWRVL